MAQKRVTGNLRLIARREGPVYYIRSRVPGRVPEETNERLGPKWTERGRPPAGFYTPKMARDALRDYLAYASSGVADGDSAAVTFRQACAERLRYLEHDKQRKPSTLRDYQLVIEHDLIAFFGEDEPIDAITTADVDALKDQLLGRVSHRTAQKVLVIMHGVMARAKRKGWIKANPCEDAEKVTLTASDTFNILEPEQVFALARAAGDNTMGALFVTGAFTGLRCPGELSALRWEHIDFSNRIVHVLRNFTRGTEGTTKGKRRRSVPLSDQAMLALDALSRREHFTAPGDLVFCTATGAHLSGDAIRDAFYDSLASAGLEHLRYAVVPTDDAPGELREDPIIPYDLRHTFGSLAVRKAPLSDVQAWMGHQDISTTMRYVHYVPQHDAAAKLSAAFAPESVSRTVSRNAKIGPETSETQSTENGSTEPRTTK